MTKPKISIITVSYNAANTIEQTIFSVVNQTYDNIEYIIVDGSSSDATVDIIKKYEDKIAYWVTEPDNGIYDAMNKGVRAAKGEYIHFLNADDCFVDNEIIAKIVTELDDDVELLSAPIWLVDEKHALQRLISKKATSEMILSGVMIPHQGVIIKADIMKHHLFSLSYQIACDFELILKCTLEGRNIRYVELPVVYYGDMGISTKLFNLCAEEYINILKKYNVPNKYIDAFLSRDSNYIAIKVKALVRKAMNAINLYRIILLKEGWQTHRCSNPFCRWCRRQS